MSAKLRLQTAVACLIGFVSLTGCDAEPLTPDQESRLERLFADLDDRSAAGVVQNLRYGGLYDGALTRAWSPQLAAAINQAHFDLDFVDERYDFESEAGMASFLSDLSYAGIRPRLAGELTVEPPSFKLAQAPARSAVIRDGRCEVNGGSYQRNGEQINVTFWAEGRDGGIDVTWNGWPNGVLPLITTFGSDDEKFPMPLQYDYRLPVTHIRMFQENGWWVTNAVKHSKTIELNFGKEAGEILLPSGDLYQSGLALENCARA